MIRFSPKGILTFLCIVPVLVACGGPPPDPSAEPEEVGKTAGTAAGNEESPNQAATISTNNTAYADVSGAQWTAAGNIAGAVVSNGGNRIVVTQSSGGGGITITVNRDPATGLATAVLSNPTGTARLASWSTIWNNVQAGLPSGITLRGSP